MKIIDNKKDYYDYLVGIYGYDSETIYDRRGSIALKTNYTFNHNYPNLGSVIDRFNDPYYINLLPEKRNNQQFDFRYKSPFCYCGRLEEFAVIIGNSVYTVLTDRYKEDGIVKGDNQIVATSIRDDNEDCPTGIISRSSFSDEYIRVKNGKYRGSLISKNVIFEGTWLAKLFSAEKVWEDIYNFLRSKKEKNIIDNRTDKEKIIGAGFDVKTSFRNIK